jgi:uncharacterized protein YuzE
MRIEYFPETDTLSIDLTGTPGLDTREIAEGLVIDLDADGRPVAIDIDQASQHLDLHALDVRGIPLGSAKPAG